jgi:hypothetical protein
MEVWVPLLGYPGYSASNLGRVRNDNRDRVLTVVQLPTSYTYVGLIKDGIQVKRSVSKLISETFLPKPAISTFTTPIHFDGNLSNCKVDNLDWRPRWFAIKHTGQFRRDLPVYPDPVRELKSEEVFENAWKAVLRYGLLYMDLILAIANKTCVFPTMQSYEWALPKSR